MPRRRGKRVQPGVLTPGISPLRRRACRGARRTELRTVTSCLSSVASGERKRELKLCMLSSLQKIGGRSCVLRKFGVRPTHTWQVYFLGAEIKAALVTLVSGEAIATFAITTVSSSVCVQPSASTHQNGRPARRQEGSISSLDLMTQAAQKRRRLLGGRQRSQTLRERD